MTNLWKLKVMIMQVGLHLLKELVGLDPSRLVTNQTNKFKKAKTELLSSLKQNRKMLTKDFQTEMQMNVVSVKTKENSSVAMIAQLLSILSASDTKLRNNAQEANGSATSVKCQSMVSLSQLEWLPMRKHYAMIYLNH